MVFSAGLRVSADEFVEDAPVLTGDPITVLADGFSTEEVTVSKVSFTSTSNGESYIGYTITLPEAIGTGQIFDFSCYLQISGWSKYGDWQFRAYDANWSTVYQWVSSNSNHATHMEFTRENSSFRYYVSEIDPPKPIKYIRIYQSIKDAEISKASWDISNIEISFVSDTGLISGILDAIMDLPNSIKTALTSLFDKVVNAVKQLATDILNGIKDLFVPSSEDLTEYAEKWDTLMNDRFGALYECADIVHSLFDSLSGVSTTMSIAMPKVTVNLAGVPWTFGGFAVGTIPSGFSVLVQTLKTGFDIISTLAFINAMKKRLDGVISN